MSVRAYDRRAVYDYAKKWAYSRNPEFYNFDAIGGNCTNFASQCIYAGSRVMNFSPFGWYYVSLNDRSPSWTSVELLYEFLVNNKSVGPFARAAALGEMEVGDLIQLSGSGARFTHSAIVVQTGRIPSYRNTLVATNTMDSFNRPLSSYSFQAIRFVHILGVTY